MSLRTRVLLVDNSLTSLVWQLVLLQEEEYDTLTASTPAEGVRIAKLEKPDLAIFEATMRPAEVLAAATDLRGDPVTSHIPILIVGGGRGLTSAAFASTSDNQIEKPLQKVEYLYKIRELLGRRGRGGGRR